MLPDALAIVVAQKLGPEFVIKVSGQVNVRPPKMVNAEIPTGEIELTANALEILNSSEVPVFEIDDTKDVTEELRLTYRYLDLRRRKVLEPFLMRHKLSAVIHEFMNREGFLCVETPVLTKSTPEGARDFLVPSRLSPGKFFALPQSPQLFKQILIKVIIKSVNISLNRNFFERRKFSFVNLFCLNNLNLCRTVFRF